MKSPQNSFKTDVMNLAWEMGLFHFPGPYSKFRQGMSIFFLPKKSQYCSFPMKRVEKTLYELLNENHA